MGPAAKENARTRRCKSICWHAKPSVLHCAYKVRSFRQSGLSHSADRFSLTLRLPSRSVASLAAARSLVEPRKLSSLWICARSVTAPAPFGHLPAALLRSLLRAPWWNLGSCPRFGYARAPLRPRRPSTTCPQRRFARCCGLSQGNGGSHRCWFLRPPCLR